MGRVFWLVLMVFGALAPGSSWAWVKIECSRNLKEDCASDQARACFDSLRQRIFIRCVPGIDERTSCGEIPAMRPDFDFVMARCSLLHECDHARSFENQFRISACMDEYSAYTQGFRCYRDAYHQFCPGHLNPKHCNALKNQILFTKTALSFLRCVQKNDDSKACLKTCQTQFDAEECNRIYQAYAGCSKHH